MSHFDLVVAMTGICLKTANGPMSGHEAPRERHSAKLPDQLWLNRMEKSVTYVTNAEQKGLAPDPVGSPAACQPGVFLPDPYPDAATRSRGRMPGMDEPPVLEHDRSWRTAVWALRVGFVALVVAIVGLIVMLSGSTPWVLGVGEISWLIAAVVALGGFFWARHLLPKPRPGFWSMRFMLIHDSVHSRSRRP